MKISSNLVAVNPNLSAKTGKVTLAVNNKTSTFNKPSGRFDTFTLVGGKKPDEPVKLSFEKTELIRNLESMSEDEKAEVAVCSYLDMQICCKEALEIHELNAYIVKSGLEERAYYNELKSRGGVISSEGGKYMFTGIEAGTAIDMKSIDNAISDVQQKIDSRVMSPNGGDPFGDTVEKFFRSSAEAFSAATGISDSALEINDDSFCKIRAGVTEENFLEKTNEAINLIRERSEQLTKVMGEYMNNNPYAKEKMKHIDELLSKNHGEKTSQMLEIFKKYQMEIESSPFKLNPFFNLTVHKKDEDETVKGPKE